MFLFSFCVITSATVNFYSARTFHVAIEKFVPVGHVYRIVLLLRNEHMYVHETFSL